jgi:DNA adenine methylase
MSLSAKLKAPFPWFGGKSRAADIIWARFGDVPNYVEPFAGSLAVLLARESDPRTETVNDLDCYIANFWRALSRDPDGVATHADWPVNEADLLARHRWLVAQTDFRDRMRLDAEYYDSKIAGLWVWGLCQWIGSGWCVQRRDGDTPEQLPHLGDAGMGIHRKLPHLGDAGRAVHDYLSQLSERLRKVRVACGEWDRVLGESVTVKHGLTAVLLDPPYDEGEHDVKYAADSGGSVSAAVREWAIANGENRLLRIALCGYEGEHAMPASWESVAWKAQGGYGSQSDGRGRDNAKRERIWFSPHCLRPSDELFSMEASA